MMFPRGKHIKMIGPSFGYIHGTAYINSFGLNSGLYLIHPTDSAVTFSHSLKRVTQPPHDEKILLYGAILYEVVTESKRR